MNYIDKILTILIVVILSIMLTVIFLIDSYAGVTILSVIAMLVVINTIRNHILDSDKYYK